MNAMDECALVLIVKLI